MSSKTLAKQVGQLFVVGFNGYSVPPEFKTCMQDFHLGGTIYFKRNVQSPAQLAELGNELQFSCRPDGSPFLFICIDHEGGKVNRLVKPFTKFPGNNYLGELGSPKMGFEFGVVIAKELKAVGINVNFAPVVDVYTNPQNSVIRSRAFSSDAEVCAKLGSAVTRGIQKMGVMAVAKHFPGHGDTKDDSHLSLPKYHRPLSALEEVELVPFRKVIRSRIDGVMTGHLWNTALDEKYPVTLSERAIEELLRTQLRYSRVIFSDDMEMKAISEHFPIEQSAVLAIKAGVDCLVYRGDAGVPVLAIESVIRAIEAGEIPADRLTRALDRIAFAKRTYAELKGPIEITEVGNHIGLPEHFRLADMITRKELPAEEAFETANR